MKLRLTITRAIVLFGLVTAIGLGAVVIAFTFRPPRTLGAPLLTPRVSTSS